MVGAISTSSQLFYSMDLPSSEYGVQICQEIHLCSMQKILEGHALSPIPRNLPNHRNLSQSVLFYGSDILFSHPDYLKTVFQGITFSDLHDIAELFCDPIRRSILSVYEIVRRRKFVQEKRIASYEAVWAICHYYLDLRRKRSFAKVLHDQPDWVLTVVRIPVKFNDGNSLFPLFIVTVVDLYEDVVIGFRATHPKKMSESIRLAIYDAILLRREPRMGIGGGVIWRLPRHLFFSDEIYLKTCDNVEKHFKIIACAQDVSSKVLSKVKGDWSKDINRVVTEDQMESLFDTFLHNQCGFGPRRHMQEMDVKFRSASKYNEDPPTIFPKLVFFLPTVETEITLQGIIKFQDVEYVHEDLTLWKGNQATIAISQSSKNFIWVFVGGEMLCRASARQSSKVKQG